MLFEPFLEEEKKSQTLFKIFFFLRRLDKRDFEEKTKIQKNLFFSDENRVLFSLNLNFCFGFFLKEEKRK